MMHRAMSIVCAAALLGGCTRSEPEKRVADASARRVTRAGEIVGFTGRYGNHAWLGIPFAQPPVGPLRWRAPQPAAPWTGVREALASGSPCTQYASPIGVPDAAPDTPVGSEDCLYLNVYAPRFAPNEVPTGASRLPVMMWIHGGGNSVGEAGFFHGGNLAQSQRVIVVAINYRLGPLGWFRHAALRSEGASDADRSGNYGTLDVIRALEWIREHIEAFGGDPNNITTFGESAGARNVFALLQSPRAKGLFQRAIVESGGLYMATLQAAEGFSEEVTAEEASSPDAENSSNEVIARLLIADGTAADRAAAKEHLRKMDAGEIEHYLRAKSAVELLRAYAPMPGLGMIQFPQVFPDGVVLPEGDPMQRFTSGEAYNQVPVIVGTNRDENKIFMFGDPQLVRRILWIFPRLRDERMYNLSAEYLAKMWKATGADEPASAMRRAQGPSVFVYRFDWDEEPTVVGANLSTMLGASHGFEIPFVFGHFEMGRNSNIIFNEDNAPGRAQLSNAMMSYWAAFAYSGAPGRGRDGTLPEWTAWDDAPGAAKFIVLDTTAGGGLRMSPDALTKEAVLAAVDSDPRLSTQRDKCAIYRNFATWSSALSKQQYASAGSQGCADYPYDTYPWEVARKQ
jgi:para-nitrobenzyl esterase